LANRAWIVAAASLLLLGFSIVIVHVRGGKAAPGVRPEVGYLAPDFTLPDLDGKPVRLSDFRGKKAIFLNFWATWCPPCRLEMPTMEKAYQVHKSRGLEILAVSIDTGPKAAVKDFMLEFKLTFPALLDPDMEVMQLYRLFSIPATILIDKEGIIRHRELGYRDWTDSESRKRLEEIL
jgi:peroxiredoxin